MTLNVCFLIPSPSGTSATVFFISAIHNFWHDVSNQKIPPNPSCGSSSWSTSKSNRTRSSLYGMKYFAVTLQFSVSNAGFQKWDRNFVSLPFMFTACLICIQRCAVFMVAHESVLETFALFGRFGDWRPSNNEPLTFDAGQWLESFDFWEKFVSNLLCYVRSKLKKHCAWLVKPI